MGFSVAWHLCALFIVASLVASCGGTTNIFDRDIVVIGGTSGSGTRSFAVLLAQLGIDVVYEHRTRGRPPFDTPTLAFLEPNAKLLADSLQAKGGDICSASKHNDRQANLFKEVYQLVQDHNLSSSQHFKDLRYVRKWLHSQAGAAVGMHQRSELSTGHDFLKQHRGKRGADASTRGFGISNPVEERVMRHLKAHINAPFPAGLAMKEVRDAEQAMNGGVPEFKGHGRAHAESVWPNDAEALNCDDISDERCPWGFKSPATLFSLGDYAQLFGSRLHFIHIVRDIRDMLSTRSHSFIQTRKFYDAFFPQVRP